MDNINVTNKLNNNNNMNNLKSKRFVIRQYDSNSIAGEYNNIVTATAAKVIMGRTCWECADWKSCSQFSSNQWRKGDGASRCRDCIGGGGGAYAGYCYAATF